jgi:hypothetical protein
VSSTQAKQDMARHLDYRLPANGHNLNRCITPASENCRLRTCHNQHKWSIDLDCVVTTHVETVSAQSRLSLIHKPSHARSRDFARHRTFCCGMPGHQKADSLLDLAFDRLVAKGEAFAIRLYWRSYCCERKFRTACSSRKTSPLEFSTLPPKDHGVPCPIHPLRTTH